MRKTITGPSAAQSALPEPASLDLVRHACVEVTSEDVGYPVEAALAGSPERTGWMAAIPGEQVLRLKFDGPQTLRRIRLVFRETEISRTQEFVIRWLGDEGTAYRDVVRQQFNFSPPGTVVEEQLYAVDLARATELELRIVPDLSGGSARASLFELRVA